MYQAANPNGFATVKGLKRFDDVVQAGVEDTAFGINIEFQEGLLSPDWDIVAISET